MTDSHHRSSPGFSGFVAAIAVLAIASSIDQLALGILLAMSVLLLPSFRNSREYLLMSSGRISWRRVGMVGFVVGFGASIASIGGHYVAGFAVGFVRGLFA